MTTESENINETKACEEQCPASSCSSGVNDAGTLAICDTPTAQPCSAPVHPGWVYFIRDGNSIKIGHSQSAEQRLPNLQTGNPNELWIVAKRKGPKKLETYYHRKFRRLKIRNEWFRLDPALHREIAKFSVQPRAPAQPKRSEPQRIPSMPKLKLSPEIAANIYPLDCALRRERDETRRMQLALRMGMEREVSTPAFKARQDLILGQKPRVRVQAVTA